MQPTQSAMIAKTLSTLLLLFPVVASRFDPNRLGSYIEELRACKNIVAVSVAAVQLDENENPTVDFTAAYGTTDPTNPGAPSATADTRFCIASLTKSFTGILAGKTLYEKPEYKETLWDTPIRKMVPDASTVFLAESSFSEAVTVRDLLAHRMGITRYDGAWLIGQNTDRKHVWRNMYRWLKPLQPISKYFRSSFYYNNWMYSLVGHILEEVE